MIENAHIALPEPEPECPVNHGSKSPKPSRSEMSVMSVVKEPLVWKLRKFNWRSEVARDRKSAF